MVNNIIVNRTIELKDDEIEKLTRRLNETKKECSIFQNELDGLDYDKGKLEQENVRNRHNAFESNSFIGETTNED